MIDRKLEMAINRYLDNDISDEEFARIARVELPDFDIEAFRRLRDRIERIEYIYSISEEPEVPDGYWETFSDRVAAKLPGEKTAKRKTSKSLADIVIPWRWNWRTFGYAGAVAAAVFVFFIGRAMIEKDKEILYPHMAVEPERSEQPEVPTEAPLLEMQLPEGGEKDQAEFSEPGGRDKDGVSIESRAQDKFKTAGTTASDAEPASGKLDEVQAIPQPSVEPPVTEQTIVQAGEDRSKVSAKKTEASELAASEEIEHVPSIVLPESSYVVQLLPDSDRPSSDLMALKSMATPETARDIAYIHNMNESDIRKRLAAMAAELSDSLYSSAILPEFAELRYSLAIKTQDSTDIYDAMNTIDTLLILNPRIYGKDKWIDRQNILRDLPSMKP